HKLVENYELFLKVPWYILYSLAFEVSKTCRESFPQISKFIISFTLDFQAKKKQRRTDCRQPKRMALSDKAKADFFLLGVILTFLLLTLVAFLLNEGKHYIDPLLKRCFPKKYGSVAGSAEEELDAGLRRSTYAKTRQEDDSNESRELNTIVESCDIHEIPKISVSDTTCNL
uniref:Uncharacterized protein n=1 Tax=Clytia hemisphaerica TaxID=252671 RepID=A0A7M6DRS1_9CNID